MRDEHEKWMNLALELATEAGKQDEVPVGCVVVVDGKLIAKGMNLREETHRTLAHAELIALDSYNSTAKTWRLPENTSVYVTAEPCTMCTGALLWARAANIFYGCADQKNAGIRRQLPFIEAGVFDHRFTEVQGGILESDCAKLLKDYFRAKRGGI